MQPCSDCTGGFAALRQPVDDLVPRHLGLDIPVTRLTPSRILGQRPVLWMIERADQHPGVWVALVEEHDRGTAFGAKASPGEFAGPVVFKFALREPEDFAVKLDRDLKE